jgi:hypothetical protein
MKREHELVEAVDIDMNSIIRANDKIPCSFLGACRGDHIGSWNHVLHLHSNLQREILRAYGWSAKHGRSCLYLRGLCLAGEDPTVAYVHHIIAYIDN